MQTNPVKNEQGQTLIIIFILMLIALSIGISISTRFISNLSSIVQTDNASMALGVAEAGIENILILPISTIEGYADNGNCTTDCQVSITTPEGQNLTATVEISKLGNSSDPYVFELKADETSQVNLSGYPANSNLYVCWNASDMSVTGTYISGTQGSYDADAFSYNPPTTTHADNNFSIATALLGYNNCITLVTKTNSVMLRLKGLYDEQFVAVMPGSGLSLPTQGILIESTGIVGNTTKKVSVLFSDPILPSEFDYALYQESDDQSLSN